MLASVCKGSRKGKKNGSKGKMGNIVNMIIYINEYTIISATLHLVTPSIQLLWRLAGHGTLQQGSGISSD